MSDTSMGESAEFLTLARDMDSEWREAFAHALDSALPHLVEAIGKAMAPKTGIGEFEPVYRAMRAMLGAFAAPTWQR